MSGSAKLPKKQKVFRRIIAAIVAAPLFVAVAVSVAVLIELQANLSFLRARIETAASNALGRAIAINGDIEASAAFSPTIDLENILIANPVGWANGAFVAMRQVKVEVKLLPLLTGDIHLGELIAEGVVVNLQRHQNGERNWVFERQQATDLERPGGSDIVELKALEMSDVTINYQDGEAENGPLAFIRAINGSAENGQSIHLSADANILGTDVRLDIYGGTLERMLESGIAWPIEVSVAAAGNHTSLKGEIASPFEGQGLSLDFKMQMPDRNFVVASRITDENGIYSMSRINGHMGPTNFTGKAALDTKGIRPTLTGSINVPVVDVQPIYGVITRSPPDQPEKPLDVDTPILRLDLLKSIDTAFTVNIEEVVNSVIAVSATSFTLNIEDGALSGPLNATVADVLFEGEIRLEPQPGRPSLELLLSAQQSEIGQLLELLVDADNIKGGFEQAELAMSAQGDTIRTLFETAAASASLKGASLSYGNGIGERPVDFELSRLDISYPAETDARISAQGALLGEPFALQLTGGTFLENLLDQERQVTLTAKGGGATLDISGLTSAQSGSSRAKFTYSLSGAHVGKLASWMGVMPEADVPYRMNGLISIQNGEIRARVNEGLLGTSDFAGTMAIAPGTERPAQINLFSNTLNLPEFTRLFPDEADDEQKQVEGDTFSIDVPIVPNSIKFDDADISVSIMRLLAEPGDFGEISFQTEIRNGYVDAAPFSVAFAGSRFDGDMRADFRSQEPAFDLSLNSKDVDIGRIFGQLGIVEDMFFTADNFNLSLALRGVSTRDIIRNSSFAAGIDGGSVQLRDANTDNKLEIEIENGLFSARPGEALSMDLTGAIKGVPIEIALRSDSVASLVGPKEDLTVGLTATLLQTKFNLTGIAPLPFRLKNLDFALNIEGTKLNNFDNFLGVSLPPWGPYQLKGRFGSTDNGYYLNDLLVNVENSTLSGRFYFDTMQETPHFQADLVASSIQLEDFDTGEWSATKNAVVKQSPQTKDNSKLRYMLSPALMQSLNSDVSITVEEVLSGPDRMGSGVLSARLVTGRLDVNQLSLDIPGGHVSMGFSLEPTEAGVVFETRANISRFDYGILARRIDPNSATGGLLSVDMAIEGRASDMSNVMGDSSGHLEFAVWPRDLDAGLFDLWAVNLFTAMLPSLDSETSRVNCAVGRFRINDGLMVPVAILVDTSRIQASGKGTIDFKNDKIDFTAKPKPKRPQMFSAQTPIAVSGQFSDFKVGAAPGGIVGTAFRFVSSPFVAPFNWAFKEKKPVDGKLACEEAWSHNPPN